MRFPLHGGNNQSTLKHPGIVHALFTHPRQGHKHVRPFPVDQGGVVDFSLVPGTLAPGQVVGECRAGLVATRMRTRHQGHDIIGLDA